MAKTHLCCGYDDDNGHGISLLPATPATILGVGHSVVFGDIAYAYYGSAQASAPSARPRVATSLPYYRYDGGRNYLLCALRLHDDESSVADDIPQDSRCGHNV